MELPNRSKLNTISMYHPDTISINVELLESLATPNDIPCLLLGVNAKSPSWGCSHLDHKGLQLEDLLTDLDLIVLYNGRTHLSISN